MCESVNSWLCMFSIISILIVMAKVLELSARNEFRMNGVSVDIVNNVVSVLVFGLFLILCYIYLFYI